MDDSDLQDASPAEGAPALPDANAEQVAPPTTTDEATDSTPADDASEEAKPKGVGKRIDELTRNWRQTERDRDYWREMAMRGQTAEKPPEPAKPVEAPKIPSLADYEYDETKYQAALLTYTEAVAERKAEAVLKAERDRQAAEAAERTWKQRAEDFAKSKPDYAEKVTDPSLPITAAMAREIQSSEIGPEIAYHLAENRDLAAEIAALSGPAAARAIGRVEGRLLALKESAASAVAKPAVSKAPPPPPRIEAAAADLPVKTTDASGDALSDDEWVKAERLRISKLRKRNG
jgi:hypothetical protein